MVSPSPKIDVQTLHQVKWGTSYYFFRHGAEHRSRCVQSPSHAITYKQDKYPHIDALQAERLWYAELESTSIQPGVGKGSSAM